MLRATEIPESFDMFVLHQNRVCHGMTNSLNYVKQEKLPKFLNFVMWGHEHECRIRPEEFEADPRYFISQPGEKKTFLKLIHTFFVQNNRFVKILS